MRAWRTPAGFLADLGPTSQPVISTLVDELPEGPWRDLHEFAALDSAGTVREWFRVSVWSVEDDLGVSTHAVIDGELRSLTVEVSHAGRSRRHEKTIVSGLEGLSDLTFVREALERRDRQDRAAIDRRNAEGDARVAAIPGALEEFGLGESFQRAQAALANRVRSIGDSLEIDLLRTLATFGRLHGTRGREPAFGAALDAYVTACRLAAFDPAPPPKPFSGAGIDVPDLREPLTALERELRDKAEQQEWSDARLNAIEYRKAADHVARARALLALR